MHRSLFVRTTLEGFVSRSLRFGLLLMTVLLASVPGLGQTPAQVPGPGTDNVPVADVRKLIDELVQNNPAVRAARYRYEAATKRAPQLSAPPEPKLTFVNFGVGHPVSRLNASNFAYQGFGVSQEVP